MEECTPYRHLDVLVDAVFTPAEQAYIASNTGLDRHRAFFRLWTVKEALVKALGTGLSLDLSDIESVGYDFLPETTHFLQLEEPRECVETMLAFLDEVGVI